MNSEEIKKRFEAIEQRLGRLENNSSQNPSIEVILEDIFDIDGDDLTLLKISGEKTKDKSQNVALLVLLGHKEKFNNEKIHSSLIKKNVALHGIPIENFGTHLNELIPQSIIRMGKKGSNKVVYKLTLFGEAKAKRLRREILEGENEEAWTIFKRIERHI